MEEQILADFFHAARLRDTTMMARVSLVDFNPRTDGIVESFDVGTSTTDSGNADRREVTLDAQVRGFDGATVSRAMSVTLQRGSDGRWRVAAWKFTSG